MAAVELIIKVDKKDVEFVKENFKPTGYSSIPLSIQNEFISAVLNGVPDSFMNKPCISSEVCEHDKNKVLDKIRAEIEQTASRYSISRERGGMGQVEWSDNLIKESEVLEIIDKYKSKIEQQKNDCDNKARAILSELCEK